MSATEYLSKLIGIMPYQLTKAEFLFLEAELFLHLYEELKDIFKKKYKDYFILMKFTEEMEHNMLENNFIRFLIEDILSTEEYTLEGIACYTDTHQDIIQEIAAGRNTSPSAKVFQRVIKLHRSVRRDLYQEIIKKISLCHDVHHF